MVSRYTSQVMSKDLIVAGEQDTIRDAYQLMREHSIRHLPVRSEDGEITGILSDRDVMRATSSKIVFERGFIFENLEIDKNLLVEDYMTTPVLDMPADTPLKLVAEKMIEYKISSFLVTEGEKVVGIVTTEDLLKVLVKALSNEEEDWKINLRSLYASPLVQRVTQSVADVGI